MTPETERPSGRQRLLGFGWITCRAWSVWLQVINLPLIYLFAAVLGVAEVVALIAGASIVPSVVPRNRWQLVSSRITTVEYLSNGFLDAPVGGFLVAAGFTIALGTTALVYLAGAMLLFMMAGDFAVKRTENPRPVRAEIREGLQFLWQHRLLRGMAS